MIAVLRYPANLRLDRREMSKVIRRRLAFGEYSSSSGLFSRLRGPGEEPQAAEEEEVAVGGSDRSWVGWVTVGEAEDLAAALGVFPAAEDLAASAVAAAAAAGPLEAGEVRGAQWAMCMKR